MRASEPFLSTTSQTLSGLVVIPPSAAAGPTLKVLSSALVFRSTFARLGVAPHSGIHRLPNPLASPAQGSPRKGTVATSMLVFGSIRLTAFGPVLPTHTASGVIA